MEHFPRVGQGVAVHVAGHGSGDLRFRTGGVLGEVRVGVTVRVAELAVVAGGVLGIEGVGGFPKVGKLVAIGVLIGNDAQHVAIHRDREVRAAGGVLGVDVLVAGGVGGEGADDARAITGDHRVAEVSRPVVVALAAGIRAAAVVGVEDLDLIALALCERSTVHTGDAQDGIGQAGSRTGIAIFPSGAIEYCVEIRRHRGARVVEKAGVGLLATRALDDPRLFAGEQAADGVLGGPVFEQNVRRAQRDRKVPARAEISGVDEKAVQADGGVGGNRRRRLPGDIGRHGGGSDGEGSR